MRCYEQVGLVFIRFLGVKIDSVTLWCFEGQFTLLWYLFIHIGINIK